MTKPAQTNTVAGKELLSFIERVERLNEEKKSLGDDVKDVMQEAKGRGFDVKIIRKVISLRGQDRVKRQEEQEMLDLYIQSIGMLD